MKQFKQLGLSKRQSRKLRKLIASCAAFAALALAAGPAQAEPVTGSIATALMYIVGYDTAIAIATAVVSYAASAAITYAVGAITPAAQGGYSSQSLANRTHMIRSPVSPRQMVYGRAMVSGPLAFIGTSNRGDGPNGVGGTTIKGGENQFLHMIVMLANHEIDAVEEIYLGDEPIWVNSLSGNKPTTGKFGGLIEQGETVSVPLALNANGTGISLTGLGAASLLGVYEVGQTTTAVPGGGESGVDAFGNPILPNGGTAAIEIPATLVNANTISVTTPVNRVRNVVITYISKGAATSYVDCHIHLGSAGQTANTALMAACPDLWTSAHRLQGIAYVYLRLTYNTKIFPNGIPNVKALIRGAKVRDPRNGSYPSVTPAWTANYALCAMDYLKSSDGLGCTDADLDLDQIKVAANVCDEVVQIRPQTGSQGTVTLAMSQKRYEVHGPLLLDHDVEENLRSLSTAGGGPVPLLVAGKFQIPVGYYGTPNVSALTASDLRGAVKVRPRTSRRDLFNAVGGTYVDGRFTWQPTDFPEVANALYKANDNGEKIRRDITLPFTTDEMMAQRLAKILLERSRQGITIEWPGKPSCFRVQVNDLVPVTLAKFGWTNKVFRCVAWSMQSNGAIDLVLQEDAAGIYDWNYGQATTTDLSKDTDLPDPSYVAPMGALTLYSDSSELVRTGDGTIISRLHVLWPETIDNSVRSGGRFEIQYKKSTDTFWTPWEPVSGQGSETWIFPVVDTETYFVRVRAVNSRDIPTDWVYGKHKIIGNTAPPPNVAGFNVTVRADGTRQFSWTTNNQPVNVTTGGGYRIRYRNASLNTAWADMTPLHNGLLSQSPLQTADPGAGTWDFGIVAVNANRAESTPVLVNDALIGKEPVSYDASANMIANSDWQLTNGLSGAASLFNWETSYSSANANTAEVGRNFLGWNNGRAGAWVRHANSLGHPSEGTASSYELSSKRFPCINGVLYEVSVLANVHRCAVGLNVDFFNSSGTAIGTGTSLDGFNAGNAAQGGTLQSGFGGMRQLWGTVFAPTGAVTARVRLIKWNTNAGSTDSYAFWNRALMCPARTGVTRETATPWIEAGADQLHGGSLTDLSVNSAQLANEAATSINIGDGGQVTVLRNTSAGGTALASKGYVAPVDCRVTVYYYAQCFGQQVAGAGGVGVEWGAWLQLGTGGNGATDSDGRSKTWFNDYQIPEIAFTIHGQRQFDMTAGQELGFYLDGAGGRSSPAGTNAINLVVQFSRIRIEAVKK